MRRPKANRTGQIRVLFVANDPAGGAVTRYRCDNLAAALPADRFAADVVYIGEPRVRVDHDIVVLHRICDVYEGRKFLAAAHDCGAVVIYGSDDLVFEEGAFDNEPAQAHLRRFARRHLTMLRAADGVLVSTEFLAERARAALNSDTPVLVVRNFLSDEVLRLSAEASLRRQTAARSESVTMGYLSGTPTHDADLATISEPLSRVMQRFPQTKLVLVGPVALPEKLKALGERVLRRPLVPWETLPAIYAEIDINLAPLDLNRVFNHAKSEIKFLEAGAVGVPTVCAGGAGFREAIGGEPGLGSLLACSAEEWTGRLTALIEDLAARNALGLCANRYVLERGAMAGQRDHVTAAFDTFAMLHHDCTMATPRATIVNWPFSPKFAVKHALRRLGSGI